MTLLTPFLLLQPGFALAAGSVILHERMTPALLAGAVICIAGAAVSQSGRTVRRSGAEGSPSPSITMLEERA